jgi:putative protein-disulfide isomerase
MPSGLFIAPGLMMPPGMGDYIWNIDQRIAKLTGQEFSARYRSDVLGRAEVPADSGPATQAVTAAWLDNPAREAEALFAIQRARYVEGRDICNRAVLRHVLDEIGLPVAARIPDHVLIDATETRVAEAQALMRRYALKGVPALLVGTDRALPNGLLFGPHAELFAAVT